MRALPSAEETAAVLVRVPVEAKAALIEQARQRERSLSGEVRVLLTAALERDETEEA
jgi:hypothetical protein